MGLGREFAMIAWEQASIIRSAWQQRGLHNVIEKDHAQL